MKAFKISGLCLSSLTLMVCSSCGPRALRAPTDNVVVVTNCQANPTTVEAIVGDTVKWDFGPPAGHAYDVHFKRTPFDLHDPPIGVKNTVKGDGWCNALGIWCYYEYVITKDGGKPCTDPGVHVGSGGN